MLGPPHCIAKFGHQGRARPTTWPLIGRFVLRAGSIAVLRKPGGCQNVSCSTVLSNVWTDIEQRLDPDILDLPARPQMKDSHSWCDTVSKHLTGSSWVRLLVWWCACSLLGGESCRTLALPVLLAAYGDIHSLGRMAEILLLPCRGAAAGGVAALRLWRLLGVSFISSCSPAWMKFRFILGARPCPHAGPTHATLLVA
jgi:hypothetical protein